MDLSRNIIKRYVQVASPEKITSNSETVYGTVVNEGETLYVKIDGSDILTPVSSTIDIKANDRVLVLVKNHEATVIGSPSSPTARLEELNNLGTEVTEFKAVATNDLIAARADIDNLNANKLSVKDAELKYATIEKLDAENATINGKLMAYEASIEGLKADKIDASEVKAKYATIKSLEATDAKFDKLDTTYAKVTALDAQKARIDDLDANKLSATDADLKYADIDFANIGDAAVENFYAASGIIQNLTLETGVVVKELVGVKIKGDLIEANTIQADKLVVKGSDGLYYKLNIEGGATTSEQVSEEDLQNGLSGSIIVAKSITAEKVAVDDLVAFGATIGGFRITATDIETNKPGAIYSGKKESATNTTLGLYLDNEGQIALGDKDNYLKFYKVDEKNYAFEISLVKALQEDVNSNSKDIQSLPKQTDLAGLQDQITGQGKLIDGLTDTTNKLADGISANATAVEGLDGRITSSDSAIQKLNASVDKLLGPAAYIREGTVKDTDNSDLPCLELGKEGSAFKVRITNKEIQFIDGQSIPAYISNQKLVIEKADVDNELRFGNFIWKERENGNMGLVWEGVNS